ncbi:MAG: pyridoxal-phosphate dependent enzyme [Sphingobacteriia bacterium]|nr:MAG: pyridoxal-phosphate dependent enzyme [Sphingobacteriia bacterium]
MQISSEIILTQPMPTFSLNEVKSSILRLDLLHPVVSGNKWFKLKYYIKEALKYQKSCIASFGGAYSNHIVALAFACKENGLQSIGIIRGESSTPLSPTLIKAKEYGMQLHFVSRSKFNEKDQIKIELNQPDIYWVNEGGYGPLGANGAADIMHSISAEFSDIICAVGTGTMIAGLIKGSNANQKISGVSVLKNNYSIKNEIDCLLSDNDRSKQFSIFHDYHFGGYAKLNSTLLHFMNQLWEEEKIPTDIVYTGKLLFAVKDLIEKSYFKPGSNLLIIHSGGLQGNSSLKKDILVF